jgi:hypothetical protein
MTHKTSRTAGALILAASIACASTATAGPAVATKWRITGESRNDCMGHAFEAIKRAGFKPLNPGSESMMGSNGDYTAAVRCVTEQGMVFFVTSGPSAAEANRLLEAIYRVF